MHILFFQWQNIPKNFKYNFLVKCKVPFNKQFLLIESPATENLLLLFIYLFFTKDIMSVKDIHWIVLNNVSHRRETEHFARWRWPYNKRDWVKGVKEFQKSRAIIRAIRIILNKKSLNIDQVHRTTECPVTANMVKQCFQV